jgi:predicted NUDIX family NTP pyrophosphohydrolase
MAAPNNARGQGEAVLPGTLRHHGNPIHFLVLTGIDPVIQAKARSVAGCVECGLIRGRGAQRRPPWPTPFLVMTGLDPVIQAKARCVPFATGETTVARRSAGIVLYKGTGPDLVFLLVHPGGPFWAKKDDGAWSIPKGEYEAGENAAAAARREFAEETGSAVAGELIELGEFRQPGGKIISAFAAAGEFDPAGLRSNSFSMEWPPKSGRNQEFPEVDRTAWLRPADALQKVTRGQRPILAALLDWLGASVDAASGVPGGRRVGGPSARKKAKGQE